MAEFKSDFVNVNGTPEVVCNKLSNPTMLRDLLTQAREKAAASESLTQEAKTMKLSKISDDVYGEVTVKTDSVAFKTGDGVRMDIKLSQPDGKELNAPLPVKGKIGARNIMAPINDMLKTMKSGESGKFITSARALFGQRVSQLGLEPSDVVVVDLKASLVPDEPKK